MIKVLIVDDHELVRMGIRRLLADESGLSVIGEAADGEQAIQLCKELKPDVVLMDANMPGINGLEATKRLLRQDPDVKVIAVTVHGQEPFPSRFIQAGAHGYLTKGADVNEMVKAIQQVKAGQRYITPEVAQALALQSLGGEDNPFKALSEREMQVLLMITSGLKVQEISDKLFLSPKTVNTYRYRLFEKLKVNSDVELTHLAIRHNLLDSEIL
ncbi:MAG: UvrY/SirA/GacA family response regulator transcription factor [Pseudomonadota bacterium]